jgi:RNA polymerase sigma-70 factor (ECF subfamily)
MMTRSDGSRGNPSAPLTSVPAADDAEQRRTGRGSPSEPSDQLLLAEVAHGSETAFRAIWERFGGTLYRVCREVLIDPEAAEDATQETFIRIWRSAGTFDPRRGEPAAWLVTIARNAARNVARVRVPLPSEVLEEAADPSIRGEEGTVDRVWLEGSLTRLPTDERTVIELAYFGDLSHTQVAARLDQPLGTVKTRIRRGLSRLADMADSR